ncbi:MAG: UDP-3-O-(3-hydroxymyristoyl)glucosamine N-acyltransferase [Bacillota bacterium]
MENKNKKYKAAELAKIVDGELSGDPEKLINGVSSVENPAKNKIVFAENKKYLKKAENLDADLVITEKDLESDLDLLKVENPRLAYARLSRLFSESPFPEQGIADSSVLASSVKIGKKVYIGENAVISDNVTLGDKVKIAAGVYIGENVEIGEGTIIYPNCVIEKNSIIEDKVIIHSGAVIGADGFGYVSDGNKQEKIAQLGSVLIEGRVEIGANTTIDRGTNGATVIGKGTKIDNLVQIGHNVEIGKNCLIVAQVGIAGSVKIEDNVTIAGQAGVVDHKSIAENSIIAARSLVTKDLKSGKFYSGNPAQKHSQELRKEAAVRKTPKLLKNIKKLEKELKTLKKELNR